MGIHRRNSPLIASPAEDQKIPGLQGVKAAAIAAVASAVPMFAAFRTIPWAKASINYTEFKKSESEMGIHRRNLPLIASPIEDLSFQDAVVAGAKAAASTAVATAVPTMVLCRMSPWAKANINHTARALIVSLASMAALIITIDKTGVEHGRKKTQYRASLVDKSA